MDPSDLDPEMAAAMGFSSFGMQPSAKKRKYNNKTDAVASSSSATGANQVALAPRAPPTTTSTSTTAPEAANTDEIALDSDDNEADRDAQDDDGGASLYADPAVTPALAHAQSLIDELATRGGIAAGPGESGESGESGVAPQPVTAPSGLPQRPNASWGTEMGAAPKTLTPRSLYQRNMRERNRNPPPPRLQHPGDKHWYEGYYDPRSNEDPWEVLEVMMRGRAGDVGSTSKRQTAGAP